MTKTKAAPLTAINHERLARIRELSHTWGIFTNGKQKIFTNGHIICLTKEDGPAVNPMGWAREACLNYWEQPDKKLLRLQRGRLLWNQTNRWYRRIGPSLVDERYAGLFDPERVTWWGKPRTPGILTTAHPHRVMCDGQLIAVVQPMMPNEGATDYEHYPLAPQPPNDEELYPDELLGTVYPAKEPVS